ncbi:hypothetical protein JL722_2651 [Aureococcus anophagefferens]|nr:hypothetical protein JL722_2651 [Aureococcus anophagefferens]
MEPVEWALYPRGAKLLDEVSATVDEAFQLRYERQELQVVAARLQDAGCCLLCLNGRLKVPSPVAPGRAMAPLLMSDFKLTYAAEADALQLRADDSGIALYRRWPNPSFRMYARDADHFAFLGTSPKRPSPDQLRAVLAEAHRR